MQNVSIGRRIKQARQDRGLSLRTLAEEIGLSAGFISRVENDLVADPGVFSLAKIADGLKVPLGQLITDIVASSDQVEDPSDPVAARRSALPVAKTKGASLTALRVLRTSDAYNAPEFADRDEKWWVAEALHLTKMEQARAVEQARKQVAQPMGSKVVKRAAST